MAGLVPPGLSALLDLFGSSWEDRIKEAAYTSPEGTRIKFLYENVSRETDKRTTAFDFPGVDNSYVQDNGYGSRRYPLRCIFVGDSCDLQATAFEAALLEKGKGKLEHPMYGTVDVVPFGTITRRDDLKSGANQTIVDVVFWSTVDAIYPSSQELPENEILAALGGFDVAAAQNFGDSLDLSTLDKAMALKGTVKGFIRDVRGALRDVSSSVANIEKQFKDLDNLINQSLDALIADPISLALQLNALVKLPARAIANIQSRIDGYQDLLTRIFGADAAKPEKMLDVGADLESRRIKITNDFQASDLFALNAVSGSVASVVYNTFTTKTEALTAADAVLDQLDQAVTWRDASNRTIEGIDTGASYQELQKSVALTAGFLVDISFSLVLERRIVLDRARTIVDLAAELYGSVDDRLDFLIESNGLTGSEILELPRGKLIRYYP